MTDSAVLPPIKLKLDENLLYVLTNFAGLGYYNQQLLIEAIVQRLDSVDKSQTLSLLGFIEATLTGGRGVATASDEQLAHMRELLDRRGNWIAAGICLRISEYMGENHNGDPVAWLFNSDGPLSWLSDDPAAANSVFNVTPEELTSWLAADNNNVWTGERLMKVVMLLNRRRGDFPAATLRDLDPVYTGRPSPTTV